MKSLENGKNISRPEITNRAIRLATTTAICCDNFGGIRSLIVRYIEGVVVKRIPQITNISEHGFWILLDKKEYFLPFASFLLRTI